MKEKLEKELDLASWPMLHPHFVRNSLYLVDDSLDFIEVCTAVALNKTTKVGEWIQQNLVYRPNGFDVEKWHKEKPLFKCLILSPHVLIQKTNSLLAKKETKNQ